MTIFLQYEVIEYEYIIFQNQVLPIAHYYLELPLMTSLVTLIILLMSKSSEAEQSASNSFSQLITLVGIFTAIAFLVFGGFSSLTNVFEHIGDDIAKTIMLVSMWGLIVSNGMFVFLGCIERIVKKESMTELFNKNSLFSWTNLILLFVFFNSLWVNIVDKYNWGNVLIKFCQNANKYVAIFGFVVILLMFVLIACYIFKHKKNK